jgi:hypothetical protein
MLQMAQTRHGTYCPHRVKLVLPGCNVADTEPIDAADELGLQSVPPPGESDRATSHRRSVAVGNKN